MERPIQTKANEYQLYTALFVNPYKVVLYGKLTCDFFSVDFENETEC